MRQRVSTWFGARDHLALVELVEHACLLVAGDRSAFLLITRPRSCPFRLPNLVTLAGLYDRWHRRDNAIECYTILAASRR